MAIKGKKEKDLKDRADKGSEGAPEGFGKITSKAELKTFLVNLRDKMTDESAAPIYAMSAINYALNTTDLEALLDNESKEVARDIWLRLKQAGVQLRNPPLLFAADEDGIAAPSRT